MNLLIALQFLTRIPLPFIPFNEKNNFANSVKYFPLAGLVLGGVLVLGHWLFSQFLPPLMTAGLIILLHIWLTGGLHLDGFMDTVDGIMSGRQREQMLAIMKDSRVGAHSVWAVLCLLLLKFSALASMSPIQLQLSLILAPVIARWQIILSMSYWPYARQEGLGKMFQGAPLRPVLWLNALLILLGCYYLAGWIGVGSFVTTILVVVLINTRLVKNLGGLAGDTYGAIIEISETLVFVLLLGLLSNLDI